MRYSIYSFVLVIILCFVIIGVQNYQNAQLNTEIENYHNQIALLQENNKTFAMQAEAQKATIAALKAKAEAEHETAKDAIAAANMLALKISQMPKCFGNNERKQLRYGSKKPLDRIH